MRKGVNLKVTLAGKTKGDEKSAVDEILKAGQGVHPELKLKTKRVAKDKDGLTLSLYIEGEDEPAHDFAKSTRKAVREIIKEGLTRNPQHKLEVKDAAEHNPDEDDF